VAIVGDPMSANRRCQRPVAERRTIVSEIPGTTRDSVDVPFTLAGKDYVLVDTAGLRHGARSTRRWISFA